MCCPEQLSHCNGMLTIKLLAWQRLEQLYKVYLWQFSVVDVGGSRQRDLSCLNQG